MQAQTNAGQVLVAVEGAGFLRDELKHLVDGTDTDLSALPLERIDVSKPQLYQGDCRYPLFERLRKESPVHNCAESA